MGFIENKKNMEYHLVFKGSVVLAHLPINFQTD